MAVDDWVLEAFERRGPSGASLRDVQRDIDERIDEELSIDVLEASIDRLERRGRLHGIAEERWAITRRHGAAAFDALFAPSHEPGDGPKEEEST